MENLRDTQSLAKYGEEGSARSSEMQFKENTPTFDYEGRFEPQPGFGVNVHAEYTEVKDAVREAGSREASMLPLLRVLPFFSAGR